MPLEFAPGDFLIFQLESGYGLMRVLDIDESAETIWHVSAYEDLFLDVEMAEAALKYHALLKVRVPHVALTDRAFRSTQVARMTNISLAPEELDALVQWKAASDSIVADRSIRLMLGFR
jgi:hypothetical protein